jgi:23S rRNA pseudouridine1911/1915/1917 synthase
MRKERKYRDDLEVIFEDQWLIVVNKPSGLLSMSTGKAGEDTAYSRVYDYAGKIFIVHRLDRDTSGLLVFAKDQETKTALQENWDEAVKERGYTALLEGRIEDEDGWIETWLHENKKSMKVHCYGLAPQDNPDKPPRKEWQFAATHCHTVKHVDIDGRTYTLVDFELETGRKNQIRVHSQWIGHPVAGDRKYGADTNPIGRLALHARALAFIHPWTGKTMRFTSRLPKSFRLQH